MGNMCSGGQAEVIWEFETNGSWQTCDPNTQEILEKRFSEWSFSGNKALAITELGSGKFVFQVNFEKMTFQNISHPSKKKRRMKALRRHVTGDWSDDEGGDTRQYSRTGTVKHASRNSTSRASRGRSRESRSRGELTDNVDTMSRSSRSSRRDKKDRSRSRSRSRDGRKGTKTDWDTMSVTSSTSRSSRGRVLEDRRWDSGRKEYDRRKARETKAKQLRDRASLAQMHQAQGGSVIDYYGRPDPRRPNRKKSRADEIHNDPKRDALVEQVRTHFERTLAKYNIPP